MEGMETNYLHKPIQEYLGKSGQHQVRPRLFACFDHEIMEFVLEGHQTLGRPADRYIPDIPMTNRYVSRNHGYFDTTDDKITYTAEDTTNGVIFRRKLLVPGEEVELWDGDELIIPTSGTGDGVDIMLVCAMIEGRINIWRDLMLSARDALTGLSGRNAFRTWYIQSHGWKKDRICLFILDIDYFKRINDVYGHSAGDSALCFLTEQLRLAVGGTGYVCRWGGDEFVGIIEGDSEKAKDKLDELCRKLKDTKIEDMFYMSISAGIIDIFDEEGERDVDALVVLADQALYRAKECGRNRVCVYNQTN